MALEIDAEQLVASLVVDGAVLDDKMILQHATPGFSRRFGTSGPAGHSLLDLVSSGDERAQIARLSDALNAQHKVPTGDEAFSAAKLKGQDHMVLSGGTSAKQEAFPPADYLEISLVRPAMDVRISPLTAAGGAVYGYLVQEIPDIGISNMPEQNARRVAPKARASAHRILSQLANAYWESNPGTGAFTASEFWYKLRGNPVGDKGIEEHEAWSVRVHPEDRPALFDYQRKLQAGKADFVPFIYRERHAKGHWMTILCKGAVIERDAEGAVVRVAGTDADITASHSAEEYIRDIARLEQRWLIAAEYGQLGLWDNDEAAGTRYVSETWRSMRGYGPDDAFDESREGLAARTHPDDRAALERQIEATVNGDADIVFQEYRERHRDGRWISILSRGRVIARDSQGRASRIIGIDTDITEIKAASEKIFRMSRRLEIAIQATSVGIWDADLAKGEVVWDERMMEIYGLDLPPGPIPEGYWEQVIHPDDRDSVLSQSSEVEAGKIAFADDYRVVRPDGTVRYIRSRSTELFNDEIGHGVIGVDWDVTSDVEAAEELRRAHALARNRNVELEQARNEMEKNALHDALTELPNRRYLDQQMKALFGQEQKVAMMQLDLDRFKQINDTLGHATGDVVLRRVAKVMTDLVPETATVARVGGDEFVVFFEEAPDSNSLEKIAGMIVDELHLPFEVEGKICRFGVSIGIAVGQLPSQTPDEVFENADMALYEAKNSGRGRSVFFSDRMRIAVEEKRLLADAFLGGLERDEFFCVYQPQFKAGSLQMSSVEALVRWRRPDGTVELPYVFLALAEELGVVDRVDQRVLDQVLSDQDLWFSLGLPVPRVSVNVSARRLADPQLPLRLDNLDIQPGRIAFELLETVFLDTQNPVIAANIAAIRAMGIELEIDDFGTGHASIVGMLQLQPDRLKIDQQIVRPLTLSKKQETLVRSIIEIGRMHDIDVIAEGVETGDHVRLLTEMGCNYLQGYGLGLPMSEVDLREGLRTGRW
ncbi:bifunctional diguanylate cyclase/phosphodiesterase [Pseudooceanicola sediminis]|uniref:bifunctional diguanylate cyclase/phosphodiesterase n=1 Tax=Pseudooceanicola sediminis TaxID=2211117 RepID=UPI001314ADCA|nr:PAS domain-containing protein [Pseudooceanicola sediminis]